MEYDDREIPRSETGVRFLIYVLFVIVARVVESVLFVVIAFELVWTLITKTPPGRGVRQFANRVLSYIYRLGRYLTYNDPTAPFPFDDFPPEVEPIGEPVGESERTMLEFAERARPAPRDDY